MSTPSRGYAVKGAGGGAHYGAGQAVGCPHAGIAQKEREERTAPIEQHRGDKCAHPGDAAKPPEGDPAQPAAQGAAEARSGPAGLPEPGGPVTELTLDASDPLWIQRKDFAVRLTAELTATLQGDEARVVGRVDLERGYLDLLGQVFEIEKGSYLQFLGSPKPDPSVQIRASNEGKSGQSVAVAISGRASDPALQFLVDDSAVSAGEAVQALLPGSRTGQSANASAQAASVLGGMTAGLLATSARRELGAAAPVLMIEPGDRSGEGRVRAGFELDWLIPPFLDSVVTGAYLEGIVAKQSDSGGSASTRAGALLELYFPRSLYTAGQWGPGTTWSLDFGWEP